MAKRFCKLNRRDITEHLGEIHRLVSEPKFVCRSCARSSADKANLCKPAAIPPASCQSKPDSEKVACGLLAETLTSAPANALSQESLNLSSPAKSASNSKSQLVVKKIQAQKLQAKKAQAIQVMDTQLSPSSELLDKSELKRAKKVAKKQKKYNKKLAKMIKKQQKLYKKSRKLQSQLESINLQVDSAALPMNSASKVSHIH
ncbi:hypothetical protein F2Z80_13705 [Vibrio fortis]|uniref:Uncharacterized protein n=1 Tax=Vibrio fortis TaxID=212667 RepID=A0A5N3QZA9_9VIBR|nr:hypothetical protein [Vibrio fortis]KAB0287554.1 hypothetical protein F2P58_14025 [Vibrio fortis]KAB0302116.1 hypothetical protein F2Z80_13705 [Vibrio fortis]